MSRPRLLTELSRGVAARPVTLVSGPAGAGKSVLATLGTPVPAGFAAALCAATEGWPAALRIAAAPLSRGTPVEQLLAALAADDQDRSGRPEVGRRPMTAPARARTRTAEVATIVTPSALRVEDRRGSCTSSPPTWRRRGFV